MTTLREAAQAVVDRWDTPLWKNVPATALYIAALREALAQDQFASAHTEPKFVRIIDGFPCITLAEHDHIVAQWVGLTNDERVSLEYTPQGVKRTQIGRALV